MKIQRENFVRRNGCGRGEAKQREGGSAVLLFILLLAIMMILVMANSRSLFHLRRETRLLEQQQIKRLDASQANSVAAAKPDSK